MQLDNSDCDIGTAALEHYEGTRHSDGEIEWTSGRSYSDRGNRPHVYPPGLAKALRSHIAEELRELFSVWYVLLPSVVLCCMTLIWHSHEHASVNTVTYSRYRMHLQLFNKKQDIDSRELIS